MVVLAFVGLSACAKKQVLAQAPPPPLEVPVVPPRLVGPVVVEEPAAVQVEEPEPDQPPRPRQPRPASRAAGNDPVTKVEPPPDSSTKSTEGAPASNGSSAAEPAPLLRTPDTANDAQVVREVRETLARAGDNLSKVNYNSLNPGAKAQHDTARRFIAQAEDALKGKNLVFARYVANKAENISASLLNR